MCQESGLPATAVVAGVASMSGTKSSCPSLEASSTLIRIPDMIRGVSTSRKHSVANDYTPFERLEGRSPRSSREKTSCLGGPLFLPPMNHHSRRFGWWPRSPTYSTRNPLDHPFEEIVLRATMPRGLAIRVPGSSSTSPEPESSSSFLSLLEAESRTNTFFPPARLPLDRLVQHRSALLALDNRARIHRRVGCKWCETIRGDLRVLLCRLNAGVPRGVS